MIDAVATFGLTLFGVLFAIAGGALVLLLLAGWVLHLLDKV